MQLVALKEMRCDRQVWIARTIFVTPSREIEVTIRDGEPLRPLHTAA